MMAGEEWPKVAIIVLNWNGWRDTIECLESLYQITYPNYDVILIDNGSTDESTKMLTDYFNSRSFIYLLVKIESKNMHLPPRVDKLNIKETQIYEHMRHYSSNYKRRIFFLINKINYGFAEGNNIGIKYALNSLHPKYILLLNNDTIVDSYFLNHLINFAESDIEVGVVGPKIYYYQYEGRKDVINFVGADLILWKGCEIRYGANEVDVGQWNEPMIVDKIEGSCLLIKVEALLKVGLLNPNYFAYWEDTDLCMKVKKAGYKIVSVPYSKIWHKISSSSKKVNGFYEYHMIRNNFWFMKMHSNKLELILFFMYFFMIRLWLISGRAVYHKNIVVLYSIFIGIIHGLFKSGVVK